MKEVLMPKTRKPRVGDHVFVSGNHGPFIVMTVDNNTVVVNRIGHNGPTFPELRVEWKDLSFQDVSQNALRIVREATEGK
jgi:hypothetical protein